MKYKVEWNEQHSIIVEAETELESIQEAINERTSIYSKAKTCVKTTALTTTLQEAPNG